jgi:hypothetical protein
VALRAPGSRAPSDTATAAGLPVSQPVAVALPADIGGPWTVPSRSTRIRTTEPAVLSSGTRAVPVCGRPSFPVQPTCTFRFPSAALPGASSGAEVTCAVIRCRCPDWA